MKEGNRADRITKFKPSRCTDLCPTASLLLIVTCSYERPFSIMNVSNSYTLSSMDENRVHKRLQIDRYFTDGLILTQGIKTCAQKNLLKIKTVKQPSLASLKM